MVYVVVLLFSFCLLTLCNVPPFELTSQSLTLFDNQLILVGSNINFGWTYMKLDDPRRGILSNKWTTKKLIQKETSSYEKNFVNGHDLIYIQDYQNTQSNLETEALGNYKLIWKENSTEFTNFAVGSCGVKIARDFYFVLGGFDLTSNNPLKTVLAINTTEQSVSLHGSLTHARADHACEAVGGHIIVSGGYRNQTEKRESIVEDETYQISTGTSETLEASIMRFGHQLILLTSTVWALGGSSQSEDHITKVEAYSSSSKSWSTHPQPLLSTAPGKLAVTAVPIGALDCISGHCVSA